MNPLQPASRRTTWRRQAMAVARAETARNLLSRRALPLLLFVLLPVGLALLRSLFLPAHARLDPGATSGDFAQTFYFFILRFVLFFAVATIAVRAFRGALLERSLHFDLLAPLRREVLVAGKYLGVLATSLLLLGPAVVLTIALHYLPVQGGRALAYPFLGAGLSATLAYLGIVVLATVAYGALFLLAGLFVRNPMVPAVLFLGWEMLVPFLPPFLKVASVVHWLGGLLPVPISLGPFAVLAQPAPVWAGVLVPVLFAAAMLVLAAWRARRLEITYSADD